MRVNEGDWGDFMAWAEDNGSNASAEINRFIRQCLGRIDSNIQPVNTGESVNTVWVTRDDLENAIADLAHKRELNKLGESVNAIALLNSQLSELKQEVETLKKSEPIG